MNRRIIGTLIAKDFSLFFRSKLFTALTVLGVVMFIIIYFVMPKSVSETYTIGLYAPDLPPVFSQVPEEGLDIDILESEETLKQAVIDGKYIAGVVLPSDISEQLNEGHKPTINLYFTPDVPEEAKDAVVLMIQEMAFVQAGQPLSIDFTGEILGTDTTGEPVTPRERLRPLLAIFILLMEMLGLANLLAEEIDRRTIQALLVTPMTFKDLFVAKTVTGTGLAFGQAVIFMAIVGGLNGQPLIIVATLILGAVLVSGSAFLIASVAKDFMSVLGWGILAFIIAVLPSFSIMFPGVITSWVKIIPSYYLIDAVHRAANYGSGWGDIWTNLLILLGWSLAITWLGIFVLRRKFR